MKLKKDLQKLRQRVIDRLGENPECRACGRILFADELVEPCILGSDGRTGYVCEECSGKPVLVFQLRGFKRRKRERAVRV